MKSAHEVEANTNFAPRPPAADSRIFHTLPDRLPRSGPNGSALA
jgi:hypothetical protein